MGYWLGHCLGEHFPDLVRLGPVAPALQHQFPLHAAMVELLEEGLTRAEYEPGKLELTTTKAIYKGCC